MLAVTKCSMVALSSLQLLSWVEEQPVALSSLFILFVLLGTSLWRGWELHCSLPASRKLYITFFEMLAGKWKESSHL